MGGSAEAGDRARTGPRAHPGVGGWGSGVGSWVNAGHNPADRKPGRARPAHWSTGPGSACEKGV
eukprot:10291855-Lingulodinium_polyedra.AAC.1